MKSVTMTMKEFALVSGKKLFYNHVTFEAGWFNIPYHHTCEGNLKSETSGKFRLHCYLRIFLKSPIRCFLMDSTKVGGLFHLEVQVKR